MGGFNIRLNRAIPGSFAVDTEGNLLESNKTFDQLFTTRPQKISDILAHPEEWQYIKAYLIAGGLVEGWRLKLKNTIGPEWKELFAYYQEENKIVGLLFDSTNRVKTETDLQWYQILLDTIPKPLIVTDLKGNILEMNQAAKKTFALSSVQPENMSASSLYEDPQDWKDLLGRLKKKRKFIYSTRHRRANGEIFPAEDHVRLFPYQGESKVILFVNDISTYRETEKLLFLLFSALEHANEAVIITDKEGRIVYVNPAFEKTTGYTLEEVLGKQPSILKSGYHSSKFYQELWDTILSGSTWRGRIVNRRKDGRIYTDEVTIFPARDEFSEITHFVALQRDVTREIELENHIQQVAKLEAIAQLAGGIAHEFNNILTTISGYTELLLIKNKSLDTKARNALQAIFSQAKRAAHLVNQLLDFSRRNKAEKTVFELKSFLLENEELFKKSLPKNITLEIEVPSQPFFIQGSPSLIKQVIFNLVVNARDAMPEGGKVTIRVSPSLPPSDISPFEVEKEWVCLSVSDTGHGISEEIHTRIFEPFFTTKVNGTGLGLAQVFGIVREHGGYIQVKSTQGKGTIFKIYLPVISKEGSLQQELF